MFVKIRSDKASLDRIGYSTSEHSGGSTLLAMGTMEIECINCGTHNYLIRFMNDD